MSVCGPSQNLKPISLKYKSCVILWKFLLQLYLLSYVDMQTSPDSTSPIDEPTPTNPAEDSAVKKLQAFFCQSEQVRRESSVRLSLDGLQLYLFNDMDEVNSQLY
jgi:hypothetical protein